MLGAAMISRRHCLVQLAALLLAQLADSSTHAGGRPKLRLSDERGHPLATERGEPIVA
jgi:hypothetical protein